MSPERVAEPDVGHAGLPLPDAPLPDAPLPDAPLPDTPLPDAPGTPDQGMPPFPELTAQTVLDSLPSRTAVIAPDGRILAVNRAWQEFVVESGTSAAAHPGEDYLSELRHAAPRTPGARQALAGLEGVLRGRLRTFEMDYDVAAGRSDRTFGVSIVPLAGGGAVVSHEDITWRKSLERQLSFRATHDTLTGLPNRFLLTDRLLQALNRAVRSRRLVGVLFCDLDQFKVLNDTLGHAAGDQVLTSVARRIQRCCRATDSVTRFGGDEFVVVLEDLADLAGLREIAERIRESVTAPIVVDGTEMWFGMSIGAVVTEGSTRSTPELAQGLLRDADTAMYRAKESGRNRIVVFDPAMGDQVATRMSLTMSLRNAVSRGEMRVQFQPLYRVVDDAPVGAEALVRWAHPHRGLVAPDDFIEAAEDSGTIVEIGSWVLETACRHATEWQRAGRPLTVSVNLSPRQLSHPGLVGQVRSALRSSGLAGHLLVLEITEGAMIAEPEQVEQTLDRLARLGVTVAVDDFGTGYSSLTYLHTFPVSLLKIDRSFVSRITPDPSSAALVRGIVSLARALHLGTVAEGVEDEVQLAAVRALGCDLYQGFLRAQPVSGDEIRRLLLAPSA